MRIFKKFKQFFEVLLYADCLTGADLGFSRGGGGGGWACGFSKNFVDLFLSSP